MIKFVKALPGSRALRLFPIVLSLVALSFVPPSVEWDADIIKTIKTYQKYYRQEKLFVQTDRPIYVVGEELWFSAFLFEAATQIPNRTERVLYVELVRPSGTTAIKQIFKLENGRAWGSLALDGKLAGGEYLLVAYTNWMRNAGSEFFFRKNITVVGANEQAPPTADTLSSPSVALPADVSMQTTEAQSESPKFNLSFYPEGGNLLLGVNNRIAFEGVDLFGRAMSFNGVVVDESGQVVSSINSMWDGKGYFIISPLEGHSYTAEINGPGGTKLKFALPTAQAQGLAMGVENPWQSNELLVTVSRASAATTDEPFFLLAMQDGRPKAAMRGVLTNGSTSFTMAKTDFATGIVQITLFDANKTPRCERLVFVNNNKQLTLSVSELETPQVSRGKVGLLLEARDSDGKPVAGDFAVSVTDADRIPMAAYRGANMVEYLALTSNLPGNISDPSLFFEQSRKAMLKADLLMMTNGWRRYSWQNVLSDTIKIPKYLEEPGIYVQGSLLRKSSLKKAPEGLEVTMLVSSRLEGFSEKTGPDGDFTFLLRDFNDTIKAVVQTRNRMNVNSDYVIELTSNLKSRPTDSYGKLLLRHPDETELTLVPTTEKSGLSIQKGELKTQLTRALNNDFYVDTTAILIDEVTVTAERQKSDKEKISNMYGAPDQSVGKKQIDKLVKENPWQFGLMSILGDAIPGLYVDLQQNSVEQVKSNSAMGANKQYQMRNKPSIQFRLANKMPHRFFVFVDGEMVGASDDKGVLTFMQKLYTIDELVAMDPETVAAVDLIFPKKDKDGAVLKSEADMMVPGVDDANSQVTPDDNASASTDDESTGETTTELPPAYSSPEAVLSIYTVNGGGMHAKTHYKGIVNITLQGFSKSKEFYRPNYSATQSETVVDDRRNTLAWMPSVKTDSTGRANLVFFASDVSKNFRVEVNGYGANGMAGSLVHSLAAPIVDKPLAGVTAPGKSADTVAVVDNVPASAMTAYKVVMDDGSPAAFADISVEGKPWGTFTNRDGVFFVDTSSVSNTDAVWVSKAGCRRVASTLPKMVAAATVLPRATSEAADLSAGEVVKRMFGQMYKNRNSGRFFRQGVFREQVFKGGQLVRLLDFGFSQRWPSMAENAATVDTRLLAGRRFSVEDYKKNVAFEPQNRYNDAVPLIDPFFSKLTFTDRAFLKYYKFELMGMADYQGRRMYLLQFDQTGDAPYAFYSGQMLVDAQTFGVAWLQWRVSKKGLEWVMPDVYLAWGGDQKTFKVVNESNEMGYAFNGEFWEPKFAVSDVSFARGSETGGYFREMFWSAPDQLPEKHKGLKTEDMKRRDMLIRAPRYNPQGWRKLWILPADATIKEQVKFLNEVTFFAEPDEF